MDIETLWDDFFFHLKLKNRADHTIRYYRTTRNMHQVYREATGSPSDTAQITVMQLRRFLLWLKEGRGLQPGLLHRPFLCSSRGSQRRDAAKMLF